MSTLFLAVAICHMCQRARAENRFHFPSAFVTPRIPASVAAADRGRQVIAFSSILSTQNAEEEADDTFFFKASQLAAQQRMQQLKDGDDPLAISLASATTSLPPQSKEDAVSGVEVESKNEEATNDDATAYEQSPSLDGAPQKIGSTLSPSGGEEEVKRDMVYQPMADGITAEDAEKVRVARVSGEILLSDGDKSLPEDDATTSTEDAASAPSESIEVEPTAEEAEMKRLARLDAADEAIKSSKHSNAEETGEVATPAPTQEEKVPVDPFEQRRKKQETQSGSSTAEDEVKVSVIEPESASSPTPSQNDTVEGSSAAIETIAEPPQSKLSSDGKEIFEPSRSALDMNQENVDMGLLVLTRSFLTLKSILDRKDGES